MDHHIKRSLDGYVFYPFHPRPSKNLSIFLSFPLVFSSVSNISNISLPLVLLTLSIIDDIPGNSRYTLYTLLESRSWTARYGISVSTPSLGSRVSRPGSDRAF